eukprot:5395105-Alexandrium_andersonii.AAC.1
MKLGRHGAAQDDGKVVVPGVRPSFVEYGYNVGAVGHAVRRVPCVWADQTRARSACGGDVHSCVSKYFSELGPLPRL